MIRIFKLVLLLVVSQVAFGQAPTNYTNINGRYRWIAGMFDSTFHIPKGTTPSLRTGGSTNAGAVFYNTSDSSVYTYTGTQWIKLRGTIIDTTSLSNRINLKLNISDTASMLSPYLRKVDTTNKFVTQVYKKNGSDSVFYVRGGNHLWAFNDSSGAPGGGGGGKIYYFNGGVSMGTFGGLTMYELGDTANTGTAANFTRATTGNIANFITDPGKPGLLQIPAGVWAIDAYLSETGGGSNNAEIYVQVEKWDGSTITTIATSPIEQITNGSVIDLYTWSVSIPTTTLAVTDRIIIQFYIQNTNGKTVTLYTQNGYVGQVHTTFTTGIGAINGLTAPAQYLVTGTSGTDFNISSLTDTHTFNLPVASATNTGKLSSSNWSTFNSKISPSDTASMLAPYLRKADTTVMLANYVNNVGYGLSKAGQVVSADSATLANYFLRRKDSLTSTNLLGYVTRTILADTAAAIRSADAGGTVTSIATNNGTGITGGTITGAGTLAIDTVVISTRAWRQKGIDSVAALANTKVSSVSGLAPISSSGGTTPTISIPKATASVDGYLAYTDWNFFADKIGGSGTTNYIPKFTSSSAIGNSAIYDNSGSILIGTTTTNGFKFKVSDNGGAEFAFLPNDGGVNNFTNYNRSTSAYMPLLINALNQQFYISGGEQMRLTSTGLGIGTSSPSYKLDVNGLISSYGQAELLRLRNNDAYISFYNSANSTRQAYIQSQATALTFSADGANAFMVFSTGGGAERMRLDASGNLGLSVTPSAWLSTTRAFQLGYGAVRSFTNSANTYLENNNYVNSSGTDIYLNNGAAGRYRIADEQHIWYQAASGTAGNAITFTQAMTLDASGNLGIGVTNPSVKLDVGYTSDNRGIIKISSNAANRMAAVTFYGNNAESATIGYEGGSEIVSGGVQGDFIIRNNLNKNIILTGGNVGIGTTSPSEKLDLQGTMNMNGASGTYLQVQYNGANRGYLGTANSVIASGSTGDLGLSATSNLVFGTGGSLTERMRITSGGYVGINEQTPNSYLHVKGSLRLPIAIKTATYTLTADDYTVVFDLNGNATANLPDATTIPGRIYVIKINRTNVGDILTIDPNGAQTIDGNATLDIQCQQAITIQSDGTNWRVIGDYLGGLNCL
jgi:hypothetical protein